jgi:hypothetical protein
MVNAELLFGNNKNWAERTRSALSLTAALDQKLTRGACSLLVQAIVHQWLSSIGENF